MPRSDSETPVAISRLVARIATRLAILAAIALASQQPFWAVWSNLVAIAASACIIIAVAAREPPFRTELTHWDEALAYCLVSRGIALLAVGATA